MEREGENDRHTESGREGQIDGERGRKKLWGNWSSSVTVVLWRVSSALSLRLNIFTWTPRLPVSMPTLNGARSAAITNKQINKCTKLLENQIRLYMSKPVGSYSVCLDLCSSVVTPLVPCRAKGRPG